MPRPKTNYTIFWDAEGLPCASWTDEQLLTFYADTKECYEALRSERYRDRVACIEQADLLDVVKAEVDRRGLNPSDRLDTA